MKRSIPHWQIVGFLFTSVLGTFLHFLFDLTHGNILAGLFSAVNESIWEHTKLLFYPIVLFAILEYFVWGKHRNNFWCIKLIGTLTGLILIPTLYYTYTGISGISSHWVNIAIFFFAAGFVFYLETKLFQLDFPCPVSTIAAIACLFSIAVLYTVFTFYPLHFPFFKDPLTGNYGYQNSPL